MAIFSSAVAAVAWTIVVVYLIQEAKDRLSIQWVLTGLAWAGGLVAAIAVVTAVVIGVAWVVDGFSESEGRRPR